MNLPDAYGLLSPAQLAGYAAFVFGMACFAQTDDRRFKLFMAAECAAYIVHFALLGQGTAVASTTVSLLRSLASLQARRPAVGLAFIALSLGAGAWLYSGWVSLLPIAASCIGTTALFFLQGLRMRLLMLLGTLLWLLNNLLVGSIGGSLLEACLAASNLWTIARLWRAGRQPQRQILESP
jgi:Bacterial inner membrane protein